jgi:hypothetical protein
LLQGMLQSSLMQTHMAVQTALLLSVLRSPAGDPQLPYLRESLRKKCQCKHDHN